MLQLRTPKGTFDLNPQETLTTEDIIAKVKKVYEIHSGVPITTPMFELREILMNKYGDDTKLIYNLEDQGGDICSLRYDLTVPFSRYLCANSIRKMRRYQIANVFRRDNPSIRTGRRREFIQADFDICGSGLPMVYDAEIVKMIYDILKSFEIPYPIKIKVNDKRILIGLLGVCGVPVELQQTVCSTIDKVEKLSKDEFEEELKMKGLDEEMIKGINRYIIGIKGNQEILSNLRTLIDQATGANEENVRKGVEDMELLFEYLKIYNVTDIVLDLSLARGLDYYTGLIIEAVYEGTEVGSVAGGGRYDNLCDSLSEGKLKVPCVGFSIGVTRIFALTQLKDIEYDLFVGSGYGLNLEDRMRMLSKAWSKGLRAETFPGKRVNYQEQLEYATQNNFKIAVFTGNNEISNGIYFAVDLKTREKLEFEREKFDEFLNVTFNKF